jgi:hypothetical protein
MGLAVSGTLGGHLRRKQNIMDPTSEARNIAKEQYTNVRRSLADFEERVIASRWDEDTLVRTGFDRFLGSLDRIADWLFAEGEQPEDDQPKAEDPGAEAHEEPEQVHDEAAEPGTATQPRPEGDQPKSESHEEPEPTQGEAEQPHDEATVAEGPASTEQPAEEPPQSQDKVVEPDAVSPARTDELRTEEQAQDEKPDTAEQVEAGTVDVVFVLPADVEATTVALCGEFNDWAEDDIYLSRDIDGTWQTTVALDPGRSYRYRFLLDGERWENASEADEYVPNPFGTVDSVVIVGQRAEI